MKPVAWSQTIKQLKAAILASRYKAAALANKELLTLYFNVGKLITEREQEGKWGDKILDKLSNDLQYELPGLKGFSATNIKRMRLFYQQWHTFFVISPTASDQLQTKGKKSASKTAALLTSLPADQISPTVSDQFDQHFFSVSFSHHTELLVKAKKPDERQFYLSKIATEFWSLETLKYHLNNKLFSKKGSMPNNFFHCHFQR